MGERLVQRSTIDSGRGKQVVLSLDCTSLTRLTNMAWAPKSKVLMQVPERLAAAMAATGDRLKGGEHRANGGEHEMVVSVEGSRLGGGDAEQWHLRQTDSPVSSAGVAAGPCRGQAHPRERVSQQEDLSEQADLRSSVGPCRARDESHLTAPEMRLARPLADSGSEAVRGVLQVLPGQPVALAPSGR